MRGVIISDASCLIALANIGRLALLKRLFGIVWTTPEVLAEFGLEHPEWIEVKEVRDRAQVDRLNASLGLGEASAIALALETPDSSLLVDDLKARRVAVLLGVPITGTVGLIILAKEKGIIDATAPVLKELKNAGLWISDELMRNALRQSGEG